jgi:hypothetical protein
MGGQSIGVPFPCSQLLRDAGGAPFVASMSCQWTSASLMRATSPPATSTTQRANAASSSHIAFQAADASQRLCPATSCLNHAAQCVDHTESLQLVPTPFTMEPPLSVTIAAPPFVGVCDDVPLAATTSAAAPRTLTWSVTTDTAGVDAGPCAAFLAALSTPSNVPTLAPTIPASLFASATYTFTALATDFRNVSSTPSPPVIVQRSSSAVPTVQLLTPTQLRTSAVMRFTSIVSPACTAPADAGSTVAASRSLRYDWSLAHRDEPAVNLAGGETLVMPPHTLRAGSSSTLVLAVTSVSGTGEQLVTTVTADLTPSLEPLVATIAGGSERASGVAEALDLDGSSSYDPSFPAVAPSFGWSCTSAVPTSASPLSAADIANACVLISSHMAPTAASAVLSLPANAFPYAEVIYSLELVVSSSTGARTASASTSVSVSLASPPAVAVELRLVSGTTSASTGQPLRLQGRAGAAGAVVTTGTGAGAASAATPAWLYLWTMARESDGAIVWLPDAIATARDLVLPPTATYAIGGTANSVGAVTSLGLPSGWYRVRLQAVEAPACADSLSAHVVCARNGGSSGGVTSRRRRLQANSAVGFAGLRVEINAPPSGGSVQVSPPSGVSVSTRFELTASGFSDVHQPLSYVFWTESAAAGSGAGAGAVGTRNNLAPESEQPVLRGVVLPEGQLRVGCTATDALGASADALFVTTLTVGPPTQSVAELLNEASNAANGDGSASLSAQISAATVPAFLAQNTTGSAEEQQQQAGALVSNLATTWSLAANSSAMLGTVAGLAASLAGGLDVSSSAGKAAATALLSLVDDLLEPALVGTLPPAVRNSTLGSLGGALSLVFGFAMQPPPPPSPASSPPTLPPPPGMPPRLPASTTSLALTRRLQAADSSQAFAEQVSASVRGSVDRMSIGALANSLSGEGFELQTSSFALLATRQTPAALGSANLSSSANATTFSLPPAAVQVAVAAAATAAPGQQAVVDVELVSYPAADPFEYHPSAARLAGEASELTLRSGATPLTMAALPAPVRIAIPLRSTHNSSVDDGNNVFGARCGDGSRVECEAELQVLNSTHATAVAECHTIERSRDVIFNQQRLTNCQRRAREIGTRLDAKERECSRLQAPPCSGHGTCIANGTCVCDPLYFGTTCGNMLSCFFWNASATMADAQLPGRDAPADVDTVWNRVANSMSTVPSGSYDGRGCTAVGVSDGRVVCECSHLTLFEVAWETQWYSQQTSVHPHSPVPVHMRRLRKTHSSLWCCPED